jgi:DNA ligase (NAD+)
VSMTSEFSWGNYNEMIGYLSSLWFDISSYFQHCNNISAVIASIQSIWDIKQHIDFEIDGLVVKMNDMSQWAEAWFTQHHPRYAISYKFPAEIVTTQLLSVEHSIGRTGSITPVANLEPVNIGWAIIRRATLHNYDEVHKLWVRIGDSVFLKRAGEVIPKIISVAIAWIGDSILPPLFCPSCNTQILKDSDRVRYYCPNSYGCPAQMHEKTAFAVWKHGFDIDGFGEKQAELFYTLGLIEHIWDIFRLRHHRHTLLQLEGFQEKSVDKLLWWIEKKRTLDIVTFIKALWIPWVGKKTAKTLSRLFEDRQSICYEALPIKEAIEQLPDIGPEVADSLRNFFLTQSTEIWDILGELTITFPDMNVLRGKYSWKKICITGSFEWYSRDNLVEILEKQWGSFIGSVSKNIDYLLAWEKAGWKLKKAQELWVEVLTLDDFLSDL